MTELNVRTVKTEAPKSLQAWKINTRVGDCEFMHAASLDVLLCLRVTNRDEEWLFWLCFSWDTSAKLVLVLFWIYKHYTQILYIEITEKFWPFLSSLQLLLQLFLGRIIMVHILEDKGIKARSEAGEGMAPNQSIWWKARTGNLVTWGSRGTMVS